MAEDRSTRLSDFTMKSGAAPSGGPTVQSASTDLVGADGGSVASGAEQVEAPRGDKSVKGEVLAPSLDAQLKTSGQMGVPGLPPEHDLLHRHQQPASFTAYTGPPTVD